MMLSYADHSADTPGAAKVPTSHLKLERKVKATAMKLNVTGNNASSLISHRPQGSEARLAAVAGLGSECGDLATLTLDALGVIRYCNRASQTLFKYRCEEMLGQHIAILLPQLAGLQLIQDGQANPRLRFLCRIGHQFQGVTKDGDHISSELFFSTLDSAKSERLSLIVRPVEAPLGKRTLKMLEAIAVEAKLPQQKVAVDS